MRSTSRAGMPGRMASQAAAWACWSTAYRSWNSSGGRPTNAVRVVSLAYPLAVPPMSSTMESPSRMTRSPGVWCGLAALGPEADDRPVGRVVAGAPQELADLGRDIGLRPAAQVAGGDCIHGLVRRVGRGPQPLEFLGALGPAQGVEHRSGLDQVGSVHGGSQPEHEPGPHLVLDRDAATPSEELADHARRGHRSPPTGASSIPSASAPSSWRASGTSRWGRTRVGWRAGADDEAGQALERRRVVPEQVQVVR